MCLFHTSSTENHTHALSSQVWPFAFYTPKIPMKDILDITLSSCVFFFLFILSYIVKHFVNSCLMCMTVTKSLLFIFLVWWWLRYRDWSVFILWIMWWHYGCYKQPQLCIMVRWLRRQKTFFMDSGNVTQLINVPSNVCPFMTNYSCCHKSLLEHQMYNNPRVKIFPNKFFSLFTPV